MKLDMDEYAMIYKKEKLKGPFVNRELSWIDFNRRVLSCALKKSNPMNERLNFLGITSSNLDEFISVRFAYANTDKDNEPYEKILHKIKKFKNMQNSAFEVIREDIKKKLDYEFTKPSKLNKKEKEKLHDVFMTNIFPLLTPVDVISNDINIISGMTYIGAILKRGNRECLTIIPLISGIDSLYQIGKKIVFLDDIILYYLDEHIFMNQEVEARGVFKIIKDESVILSHDESRFIVDRMEDTLNNRTNSRPLFMELREDTNESLETILNAVFKIPSGHVYKKNKIIDYKVFSKNRIFDKDQSYKSFVPFRYENYGNFYNIFDAIDNEDILLHHPYDSYETVVKFLEHAAIDSNVCTIKQTLYRVSGIDSPIVNALCKAAENGKFVTVLVEIKARFDESNNIRLINKLKKSGVNVILGDEFLKTHCKLCLVSRKDEKGKLRLYSHVATGNYNEKTAKIYTDLSYFTSKHKTGLDLLQVFNILSGHAKPDDKLEKVYYSPVNLRKQLEKCIDKEIDYAKKGKKAEVFIKVNSISDVKMVNKIYEAANAGVHINIICRGVCSLIPRKNLKIKSIVGRFLEHSRIFYFKHSGYYISSADLLTRNLDRRVETLIPIKDENVTEQLGWIISVLNEDKANSFIVNDDGHWVHAKGDFDAHQWMIYYSDVKKRKKSWK